MDDFLGHGADYQKVVGIEKVGFHAVMMKYVNLSSFGGFHKRGHPNMDGLSKSQSKIDDIDDYGVPQCMETPFCCL